MDLSHLLFGTDHNLGIPYEIVLNVKPRHEVENQRYYFSKEQFHGYEHMAQILGDYSREFEKYSGVYIKKPAGVDVKELIIIKRSDMFQNEKQDAHILDRNQVA